MKNTSDGFCIESMNIELLKANNREYLRLNNLKTENDKKRNCQ